MGASRCRNAAGLYCLKKLRRSDWLPIGGGDSDEEPYRGDASDAESLDPNGGWQPGDGESDCSALRSDGHLSASSDEDSDFNEHGTFCFIGDDYSAFGQGVFSFTGDPEPQDAYILPDGAKRRKTAE